MTGGGIRYNGPRATPLSNSRVFRVDDPRVSRVSRVSRDVGAPAARGHG